MNRRDFFTTLIALVTAIKSPKIFASIWREIANTGKTAYPIQFTPLKSYDFNDRAFKIGHTINVRRPMRFNPNVDFGSAYMPESIIITSGWEV